MNPVIRYLQQTNQTTILSEEAPDIVAYERVVCPQCEGSGIGREISPYLGLDNPYGCQWVEVNCHKCQGEQTVLREIPLEAALAKLGVNDRLAQAAIDIEHLRQHIVSLRKEIRGV